MLKYFPAAIALSTSLMLFSCAPQQQESTTKPCTPSLREYSVAAVLWQQQAAEFRALCYQAYNTAKFRLDQKLAKPLNDLTPAVIVDVDETVLDNSPFSAWQIKANENYNRDNWQKWTSRSEAEPIPGALEFLQYADSMGVEVFYVSNRRVEEVPATKKNLEKYKFPDLGDDHFLFKTTASGKEERRQKIAKEYNIVLLAGDNLNDFSDVFEKKSNNDRNQAAHILKDMFGDMFIVLPNAVYGEWESAMYNHSYDWTPEQSDSIRKATLVAY